MKIGALLLSAALGLTGCGSPVDISDRASRPLQAQVAAVRDAAEAGDAGAAASALEELRAAVERWESDGELGPGRAREILSAAGEVEAALALLSEAPVEEPSPVQTPEVEATPEDDDDDDDDEDDDDEDNSGPGSGEDD